jgi:hypothetical protein
MGFWERIKWLFVEEKDPIEELNRRIEQSVTLLSVPDDPELWKQAHKAKNHISLKAVSDEYDRLTLKKYGHR